MNYTQQVESECAVLSDPTGNTPLWDCDCHECIALEAELEEGS